MKKRVNRIIKILGEEYPEARTALHFTKPLELLVATVLSAQCTDERVNKVTLDLFKKYKSAKAYARVDLAELEEDIRPTGFFRNKAKAVKGFCTQLVESFDGEVPASLDDLVTLRGIGRKTANLVLILSHGSRDNICVDTHVHRISNRLGWVRTRTPDETEQALYRTVPKRWWPRVNLYLVTWGQNVCRPVYPRCRVCVLSRSCPKIGVTRMGK